MIIFFMPFLLLALFAAVSFFIVAYRVYIFNDCKEAGIELQEQIILAKKDLAKKGLKFNS